MKQILLLKKQLLLTVIAFMVVSSISTLKVNAQDYVFTMPDDGMLVIEAEHYNSLIADGTDTYNWSLGTETDFGDYLGAGYMVSPVTGNDYYDDGSNSLFTPTSEAPVITYKINFPIAGDYVFMDRCSFPDGNSDSFWLGLDDEVNAVGGRMNPYSDFGDANSFWGWNTLTSSSAEAVFTIAEGAEGEHLLKITQREPNFRLDRFVIIEATDYLLSGYTTDDAEAVTETAWDGATAINENSLSISMEVYPNPIVGNATITYDVLSPGKVNVSVYSLTGELISVLVDEVQTAGSQQINWSVSGELVKGIYFVKLTNGSSTTVKKVMLK